jgi:formate hydrogenlyase subunit 3/multisubunit Na+/H+ antiporter MnhD subunit
VSGLAVLLLPLVLLVPLGLALLGVARVMRRHMLALLPLAPLPGLLAALFTPRDVVLIVPDILLGLRLSLDGNGAMFLGMASVLWIAAGVYASFYMAPAAHPVRFAAFWCLTLAGNLGVFIAADVATFYVAFACMSLAAYPLVVHDQSQRALYAGRVYIVLAVIGETCLLLGFMMGVVGAGSLVISDIRLALPASPYLDWAILLLVAGFGIKAGLVPLHVWLPLAHPAAPTPASAVLSGAIVKAGIFGLIQFLPAGAVVPFWSDFLVAAGILTAYFGVLVGLTQSHPKTILAYSTMSQMGLVVAVIGTSIGLDPAPGALAAASLYALHHGLAKGALFMGVGVAAASGERALRPVIAILTLLGLAIAGLPLTGGALSKLAIKDPLTGGGALLLVTLSAVGTALLMIRFLLIVRATAVPEADARPSQRLVWPWLATAAAALILPWALYSGVTGQAVLYPLTPANLWAAFWPIALATLIVFVIMRFAQPWVPAIPEGDIVGPFVTSVDRLSRHVSSILPLRPRVRMHGMDWGLMDAALGLLERGLARWSVAGAVLLIIMLGAVFAG